MKIRKLKFEGTFEITPKVFEDSRGYFLETYSSPAFEKFGLQTEWIQENQSLTVSKGTIRGLHFQSPPFAQAKLIRVPRGRILDVLVDIRSNSETFGKWDSIEVSEMKRNSVYIPYGFAHGFCTLSDDTIVQYKVDKPYSKFHEGGICWDDNELGIEWKVETPFLSDKDSDLPSLRNIVSPF